MSTYPELYGDDRFHLVMDEHHPYIHWRTPIILTDMDNPQFSGLGCRYCIAGYGLTGKDNVKSGFVFDTPEAFGEHMAGKHPLTKGATNVH